MRSIFFVWLFLIGTLCAEEGMWTFDQIPKEKILKKYGVELKDEWIEHIQKSCLRIGTGGSGSFVSSKGLVMTNHHVGASIIAHLSNADHNYLEEGFYAKSLDLELLCPNLYFDQLISISDVTEEVMANIENSLSFSEKEEMKKSAIAEIQKRAQEKTGLQPEVVMLYQGAKYHLYLYERYTDIRLVMAPEKGIAFFGGDADNFEYPRYNLDVCFFRVYKEGNPLETEHFLKWSSSGPQEGEFLFVAGHPGKTRRMITADHLRFLKEVEFPITLQYLKERNQLLKDFSLKNQESKRIALQPKSRICNAYKVYKGIEKELQDSFLIEMKKKEESLLFKESDLEYFNQINQAFSRAESLIAPYFVLEGLGSSHSTLYDLARTLVRLSTEKNKPSKQRLLEYGETEIERLSLKILSKEPFYLGFEEVCLADGLERMERVLGKDHSLVQALFREKNPRDLAHWIINTSVLYEISQREHLYAHLEEVDLSQDPMILLAKAIDPFARMIRKQKEDELDGVLNECYAHIVRKKLNNSEDWIYPDATFTLRLSFGQMKGYQEDEIYLKSTTNLEGLVKHSLQHGGNDPYFLPARWSLAKVDLNVPLNFVSTHDIVGGNSGSPVFNCKGEWVGLVFDGNRQTLNWSQVFDERQGRAISVHCQGVLEALKHVYQADSLVEEIQVF